MKVEQVPDIPLFRTNTAAFIHQLPAQCLANVDGDSTHVRVQVLTNAGALDRDKQLAVVAQLTAIVAAAAATRHWPTAPGSCSPKRRTADGAWPATPTPTRSWSSCPRAAGRVGRGTGTDRQLSNEPEQEGIRMPTIESNDGTSLGTARPARTPACRTSWSGPRMASTTRTATPARGERRRAAGPFPALPRKPRQLGSRADRRAGVGPARHHLRQRRSRRLHRDNTGHRGADGTRRHRLHRRHGPRPG